MKSFEILIFIQARILLTCSRFERILMWGIFEFFLLDNVDNEHIIKTKNFWNWKTQVIERRKKEKTKSCCLLTGPLVVMANPLSTSHVYELIMVKAKKVSFNEPKESEWSFIHRMLTLGPWFSKWFLLYIWNVKNHLNFWEKKIIKKKKTTE